MKTDALALQAQSDETLYNTAFADGVASVQPTPTTDPTPFSQADMDNLSASKDAEKVQALADLKAKAQAAIAAYKTAEDADEASLAASIDSL